MRSTFTALLALLGAALLALPLTARADEETEAANLDSAAGLIDAFTTGDSEAALEVLSEDVEWHFYGSEEVLPLHGPRSGKAEVEQWIADVAATFAMEEFGADEFYSDGDTVIVLGHEAGTAIVTGKPYSQVWIVVLTFDEEGLISTLRGLDDSAEEIWAITPG